MKSVDRNLEEAAVRCYGERGAGVDYKVVFDARNDNDGKNDFIMYFSHKEHSFETN
jgi:hypothetical protein